MNNTSHEEKRRSPRIEHHERIEIIRESTGTSVPAQLMNTSSGGARMVCSCAFIPGEIITFDREDHYYRARILECGKRINGYFIRTSYCD